MKTKANHLRIAPVVGNAVSDTPHHGAVLAIVLVSHLMIVLDISIVITALPKIQDSLQFSVTELSWVQNAYTLAFGGLLMLGARAGDILSSVDGWVWARW